jgi:YidC/Oxa1 family membrane protein insertase
MEQKRFFLALILSTVILLGWGYFFSPRDSKQGSNNGSRPAETASESASKPQDTPTQQAPPQTGTGPAALSEDTNNHQTLKVSTPLYTIELDGRGAVARSWVLKQNKDTGRPLYSIAGDKKNRLPLELVSQEGANRGQFPLRLELAGAGASDDPRLQLTEKWNEALQSRNYRITANGFEIPSNAGAGNLDLEIKSGEPRRQINLEMIEPSTGLKVVKTLSFDPDSYIVQVGASVTQNGQAVPNVKMVIGPSTGDQGVPEYTFYSVAPYGLTVAKDKTVRLVSSDVNKQKSAASPGKGYTVVEGPAKWAAVGDTYFAMALALPSAADKVEFTTEEFQHAANGSNEQRFLISGHVPVPSDGTPMYLYVGPKDHFALSEASQRLSETIKSDVDLDQLIDYGWLGFTRPIAVQLLRAIKFLNNVTGNYGVAIIIFTIVIYTLFFPLKWRSTKSMKKAQKHAPRMKELQEKIKGLKANDPKLKELQMEQLRLMKEANPLGGCLPLLIQMPFLIALYSAITISIDFRQASFLWLPDLSAGDPIRLLPILMAGSMLVLQLITPNPSADPLQRKMMAVILPVMMLYMLWSAPSGLLLYWLVGNIVGFGQQLVINRLVKKSEDDAEPPGKKAEKKTKPKLGETRVSQA